jgi:hypothetical protein
MRRQRRLCALGTVVCATSLLALGGCSSSRDAGGGRGGAGGTGLPIGTLDAAKFHAIGVAAGAPALPSAESVPQVLHVDTEVAKTYFQDVCRRATLITLPGLIAYPNQVPAYEFIFAQVQQQPQSCPGATTEFLDHQRGNVATSMVSSQAFLDRLNGTSSSRVTGFCDGLEKTQQIDSTLISAAADKLGVDETGAKLLEFGVELLVKNCAQLLDRVTG